MSTWESSNRAASAARGATALTAAAPTILEGTRLAPPAGAVAVAGTWKQVGPAPLVIDAVQQFMGVGPVAGEVTGIAIDPSGAQDQIILITSNDGGVWKSTDGGNTWRPKTDAMPTLSMGAVVVDPDDSSVVYAGTGNFFGNQFRKGIGIYKSVDGGERWGSNTPAFDDGTAINPGSIFTGHFIKRLVIPAAGVLLVATEAGLFRSVDGGAHFGANAPTFDDGHAVPIGGADGGDVNDVAVDSVSATVVYAAVAQQGLFKSTDGGATFPAANKLWPSTQPPGGLGNVFFGQSGPVDSGKTIYVSATSDSGVGATQYLGFFKSIDGGATFAPIPGSNAATKANEASLLTTPPGQAQVGYDHVVAVDPNAPDLVYLCFQEIYVSTDGGVSFGVPLTPNKMTGNSDAQTHWDNHVLVFSPPSHVSSSPTRLYVGNDGGLVSSGDGGNTWTHLNAGVATCLFLGIDIGRGSIANNAWTYGGCQDNGTIEHRNDSTGLEWHLTFNGDGGKPAVDPNDPTRAYGSSNGEFILTTDGGLHWDASGHGIPIGGTTCVAVAPDVSANIYVGFGGLEGPPAAPPQIFFSSDTAASFTSLTTFVGPSAGVPGSTAPTSIAIAPTDPRTIYVSLENGTIQKSTDGGTTWSAATATGAPATMLAEHVAVDPTNENKVVVVYSGFSGVSPATNRTQHVFLSIDGGTTWTDASGTDAGPALQNLPDLPVYSVVLDPDGGPNPAIIIAGDGGVMSTPDNGASWHRLGTGLPNVECRSLALDHSVTPSLLRVGTFGRSVFELVGNPTPSVTGVIPSAGAPGGGEAVAISGSGFTAATAVAFGTTDAPAFTVSTDSEISATTPPGAGTVDVMVTAPGGTSAASTAARFTYDVLGSAGRASPPITETTNAASRHAHRSTDMATKQAELASPFQATVERMARALTERPTARSMAPEDLRAASPASELLAPAGALWGADFVIVVALDNAGTKYSLQVYPDANNGKLKAAGLPESYYFVPARVYLAKLQSSPGDFDFGFTLFKGLLDPETTIGVTGDVEVGGGFCTFSTTFAVPDDAIANAIQKLKNHDHPAPTARLAEYFTYAPGDPDPLLGIVPISEDEVTIAVPDLVSAGGTKVPMWIGAQSSKKGSTEAHGINSFLVTCNELAAGAIAGSLKNGRPPFVISCNLKENFYLNACTVTVTVDVDKVYDAVSLAVSAGGFLGIGSATLNAAYSSLVTSGGITTDIQMDTGVLTDDQKKWIQTNVDDMRTKAWNMVKQDIFDWDPSKTDTPAASDKGLGSLFGGASVSLKATYQHRAIKYTDTLRLTETVAVNNTISGDLGDLMPAVKANLDKYLAVVDIGEWFQKIQIAGRSAVNFGETLEDGTKISDPLASVQLEAAYPDFNQPLDDQGKPNLVTKATGQHYTIAQSAPSDSSKLALWQPDDAHDIVNISWLRLPNDLPAWPANQVYLRRTLVFDDLDPRVDLANGTTTITFEQTTTDHAPILTAADVGYVYVHCVLDRILPKSNITVTLTCTLGSRTDALTITKANQRNVLWEVFSDKYLGVGSFSYTMSLEVTGPNFTDPPATWQSDAPVVVPLPIGRVKYINPLKLAIPAIPTQLVPVINAYIAAFPS